MNAEDAAEAEPPAKTASSSRRCGRRSTAAARRSSASSATSSRSGPTSSPTATRRSRPTCSTAPATRRDGGEAPMALLRQRPLGRQLPARAQRRYLYTIEAWRDLFETWRSELAKKRDAGSDVSPRDRSKAALVERSPRRPARADGERRKRRWRALVARSAPSEGSVAQLGFCSRPTCAALMRRDGRAAQPVALRAACSRSSPTGSRRASRPGTSCSRARRSRRSRTATAPSTT